MWRFINNALAVLVVFGILGGLGWAGYRLPDEEFSEMEGRPLAFRPHLHVETLANGELAGLLETYISEQFPWKQKFVTTYMKLNMLVLDKKLMNDVVVGDGGQLLNYLKDPGSSNAETDVRVKRYADSVLALDRFLQDRGATLLPVSHPSNNSFYRNEYPVGLSYPKTYVRAQEKLLEVLAKQGTAAVNMKPILEQHRSEKPFLKTDHHWSLEAGYLTYAEIMKSLGMQPLSLADDYNVKVYGPPVFGSLNRRVGMVFPSSETLSVAELKKPLPYDKTSNGRPDQAIYRNFDKDAELGKPANYVGYMGGDRDQIIIKTHRPKLPTLLVFGDSYTNTVEPFLWPHFDETYIIDLRYHNQKSIYEWIEQYDPDYVVFLLKDEFVLGTSGNNALGRTVAESTSSAATTGEAAKSAAQYQMIYDWFDQHVPFVTAALGKSFFVGNAASDALRDATKRAARSAGAAASSKARAASTKAGTAPKPAEDQGEVPHPEGGRHNVTLPSAPKSSKVGTTFKSIGYLGPQHLEGTKPVKIYLFERTAAGEWKYQFWTQATVENFKTYSKYVANVKVPRAGAWRLQAVAPADDKHMVFRSGFTDVEVTK